MMLVDSVQADYVEQMSFENQDMNSYQFNGHTVSQQCHNINSPGSTRGNKFRNTGINNGCLAQLDGAQPMSPVDLLLYTFQHFTDIFL